MKSSPSSSTKRRPSSRNSLASRVSGAVKILQEQFYFSWYFPTVPASVLDPNPQSAMHPAFI
jgi:hypothetical protein